MVLVGDNLVVVLDDEAGLVYVFLGFLGVVVVGPFFVGGGPGIDVIGYEAGLCVLPFGSWLR